MKKSEEWTNLHALEGKIIVMEDLQIYYQLESS